jgi:hypothetical protein
MSGACCIHGRENICTQDLAGKQRGKSRGEIKINIKIHPKETETKVVACFLRNQDRN